MLYLTLAFNLRIDRLQNNATVRLGRGPQTGYVPKKMKVYSWTFGHPLLQLSDLHAVHQTHASIACRASGRGGSSPRYTLPNSSPRSLAPSERFAAVRDGPPHRPAGNAILDMSARTSRLDVAHLQTPHHQHPKQEAMKAKDLFSRENIDMREMAALAPALTPLRTRPIHDALAQHPVLTVVQARLGGGVADVRDGPECWCRRSGGRWAKEKRVVSVQGCQKVLCLAANQSLGKRLLLTTRSKNHSPEPSATSCGAAVASSSCKNGPQNCPCFARVVSK